MKPVVLLAAALACFVAPAFSQLDIPYTTVSNTPPVYGPYNGVFLAGGDGLTHKLTEHDSVLEADAAWTLYAWVRMEESPAGSALIAGFGNPDDEYARYLALREGKLALWAGADNLLASSSAVGTGAWHFVSASFDGTRFTLYLDGERVSTGGGLALGSVSPVLALAPPTRTPGQSHFAGKIAGLTLLRQALSPEEIASVAKKSFDFSTAVYEEGSKPWPIQTRGQAGYRAPQDAAEMPRSKAPFSAPVAIAPQSFKEALATDGANHWTIVGGWRMSEAPKVSATGDAVSASGFDAKQWYVATVPGTVLTTLVDRGVYPDPDYGLNNLAIPESLNKQDYWYRTEFRAPAAMQGKKLSLTFQGINYKAAVWLNGKSLGTVTGAFIRGDFDVTGILKPNDANILAVKISPPPHPGIPQEQSIKGGPGENGGTMELDGPTFLATEGWDWIPAIRDRDTGLWQPVTITATDGLRIGDPQVVTTLPLPDVSRADVAITVPVLDTSDTPARATVKATFEGVTVNKNVLLSPGVNTVKFTPAEFAELTVHNPRLWWPNGYGKPELYHLRLEVFVGDKLSDTKELRFGIREISYELSLLDSAGHLRRVEYTPAADRDNFGKIVDVTHNGMRNIPASDPPPPGLPEQWRDHWRSYVASLYDGAEKSPSIRMIDQGGSQHYLVVKVNGVRIACRGGNWGMDDARKRVTRERLEPYFRLDRDAHLNIIRNWLGSSTEDTFFDLADEYGMLVWNDFWESTQDYNIEAQDPDLFLKNAADVIARYRNHPSILLWCGRNEGVPQPIISQGLIRLNAELDGTRYYTPSSNRVNLQDSGPYSYQDPKLYYTRLNRGFSVETGTPSMSTLESFQAWTPKPDQWPIDDVWAYHDWHALGNGATGSFMNEIQNEFGAATSLPDFERKAQMLNYVDHRAIFEGMNAHLWSPNSGRMLWMTQPAWPSNMWEILSSDYDTQASFYGTMKACEPLHVQLNLASYDVEVVNTTRDAAGEVVVTADVVSLDNKPLLHQQGSVTLNADGNGTAFHLPLEPLLAKGLVLIKLEMKSAQGAALSQNLYWLGNKSEDYRALDKIGEAQITASVHGTPAENGEAHLTVNLKNSGSTAALETKLTLANAKDGTRILPAYYSDNYVSLLPGESRDITIDFPAESGERPVVNLRGWNVPTTTVQVTR